ncbi:hypothetical protein [Arachnia propionica]|jgi:hypothetical protein|uniref:DUF4352 domain-containing protein n=1 Tax=Arachnia propionica TaxID=1750 RepID=A0A448N0N2_9ACTN|nr:hypothetical protein [Arachnia propionica]QUC13398.1 hypothetical protein J5A61_11040 [Arachnia propionica]VEH70953.1 Uncharacterised protein [Arachnia propionica]
MTLPAHSRIAPPGHDIPPGVLTGPGPDMVSRRRFPRCLTVLSLTVALLLGSWLTTQLPDRDTVAAAPFLRPGKVGQDVELRTGTVKVTNVRSAAEVKLDSVATTSGIWLVVTLDFIPKGEQRLLRKLELKDGRDRVFNHANSLSRACGPAQPGLILGCEFALEVPKDALPDAELHLSTNPPGSELPDDVAVIDLEIDEARAEQLGAETQRITIAVPRTKGKA